MAEYGLTVATAIAYGMNSEFSQVLALEMRRFNEAGHSSSIMQQVHGQIDELRNIMVQNIDNVTARGERIELLVDKTENLRNSVRRGMICDRSIVVAFVSIGRSNLCQFLLQSVSFRQTSQNVARMMFWRNVKMYVILAGILLFVVYVIISMACGGLAWQTCIHRQ